MADYWTTPKTNWVANDGIGYEDLNRIEANISGNRDANFRKVQGFGYSIDNSVVGKDGVITMLPGSCYSENGYPIRRDTNIIKNLTSWVLGSGADKGGMASAVTVAAHTWYYAFILMDPTNGNTEIMFDDNPSGTNVSSGTYTEKRFINSFKTGAAGGDGSFDLIEMYSFGDRVYINPNSMYAARGISFNNSGGINNLYQLITLTSGGAEGLALPARNVRANIELVYSVTAVGFISEYNNLFTIPAIFFPGPGTGTPVAEFFAETSDPADHIDFSIIVDQNRQINMAMYDAPASGGALITTRGFVDERLI